MYIESQKRNIIRLTFEQRHITDDIRAISIYDATEDEIKNLINTVYHDYFTISDKDRVKLKVQMLEFPKDKNTTTTKNKKKELSVYLYGCNVNIIEKLLEKFNQSC